MTLERPYCRNDDCIHWVFQQCGKNRIIIGKGRRCLDFETKPKQRTGLIMVK